MKKVILLGALSLWTLQTAIVQVHAQLSQEQMADMLLARRKAYNEKQWVFAAGKFREFLGKFGQHKEAGAARYGLALTLLETPGANLNEPRELLQALAGKKDSPDYAFVAYHLGLALRTQGIQELKQSDTNPNAAAAHRGNAQKRFEEAPAPLTSALTEFSSKTKDIAKDVKELPVDVEWAARARCDLAELQLRLSRAKNAQNSAAPFLKGTTVKPEPLSGPGSLFLRVRKFLAQGIRSGATEPIHGCAIHPA